MFATTDCSIVGRGRKTGPRPPKPPKSSRFPGFAGPQPPARGESDTGLQFSCIKPTLERPRNGSSRSFPSSRFFQWHPTTISVHSGDQHRNLAPLSRTCPAAVGAGHAEGWRRLLRRCNIYNHRFNCPGALRGATISAGLRPQVRVPKATVETKGKGGLHGNAKGARRHHPALVRGGERGGHGRSGTGGLPAGEQAGKDRGRSGRGTAVDAELDPSVEGKWVTACCNNNCGGMCLNKVYVVDGVVVRQKTDDTAEDSRPRPSCAPARAGARRSSTRSAPTA